MITKARNQIPKTKAQRPKTDSVAAIILAAGRSERMGAFKPLLPFGSQTVIDSCIKLLYDGGVATIIAVLGQDQRAEELKHHLKDSGVSFAINPHQSSEMSASIACGVRELPESSKAVIITPADHPAVPAEVVEQLINEWQRGARLVMPIWKGRGGHPVLIDLSFREQLLGLDPDRGLKALFDEHQDQLRRLSVNSNYIARDMDTWDDYAVLHQEVFGVSPPERPASKQA
jgi:molybdenum cofactor cytidylyltransferase